MWNKNEYIDAAATPLSNEAIQSIASVYNKDNLTATNINATGNIGAAGNLTATNIITTGAINTPRINVSHVNSGNIIADNLSAALSIRTQRIDVTSICLNGDCKTKW